MINPIQLIKESIKTYKVNFKNIIFMVWPIILLAAISMYTHFWSKGLMLILAGVVTTIVALLSGLYFKPALYRVLQKNEDNNSFDGKDGYNFQKKNIWNFIVLYFWSLVYALKYFGIYIIITGLLVSAGMISSGLIGTVFVSVGVIVAAIGIIKNITKFAFQLNIFFSEDIKPRDAVKKSIDMEKGNIWSIWKILFAAFLVNMIISIFELIVFIILVSLNTISFVEFIAMQRLEIPMNNTYVAIQLLSSIVSIGLAMPLTFIVVAKAYNKLKGHVKAEVVEDVEEATV